MAGMTSTGFVPMTLSDIKTYFETQQKALISPTIDVSSASVTGQQNGIYGAKVAELWELGQALYNAINPDQATGRALDLICALTGTIRLAATSTVVTANVTLAAGTYAAGSLVASVSGSPTSRFQNQSAITTAGGVVSTVFVCQTTGPVACNAGTLTVIAAPVSGWSAVTNPADASTLGTVIETDAALRRRREQTLATAGSTTVNGIQADILNLAQTGATAVTNCTVLENTTDVTDGNGLPPHSIECIVYGPTSPSSADDQAVANQIFASKAAGCATASAGGTSVAKTVVDSQLFNHTINFTRPTAKNMHVTVTTVGGTSADVKTSILAYGATLKPGDDVIAYKLAAAIADTAGVSNLSLLKFDTTGTPANTADYAIAIREVALFDTANITVTVT